MTREESLSTEERDFEKVCWHVTIQFLAHHNALVEWMDSTHITEEVGLSDLSGHFPWSSSPSGASYWSDLDHKQHAMMNRLTYECKIYNKAAKEEEGERV